MAPPPRRAILLSKEDDVLEGDVMRIEVRAESTQNVQQTFGIFVNDELMEGGFSSRKVAEHIMVDYKKTWQMNVRNTARKGN